MADQCCGRKRPFNRIRIALDRMCGFKIGKGTFIGMRCYLDDMCYDLLKIGSNVIISYGVFFACHGRNQEHIPIMVDDGACIGMRASIITKTPANAGAAVLIGKNAVVGGLHARKLQYSRWSNGGRGSLPYYFSYRYDGFGNESRVV